MIKPILALVGLSLSLASNAAYITHGSLSTDDTTNIITDSLNSVEYLRLDVIAHFTYAQTLTILNTQDGGGWHIAGATEAVDFTRAMLGGSTGCAHDGVTTTNSLCGNASGWDDGHFGDNFDSVTDFAWFHDDNGDADFIGIKLDERLYLGDGTLDESDWFADDGKYSDGPISWLLVRPAEVPLPAAGWLFISALVGLAGKKRLSRR